MLEVTIAERRARVEALAQEIDSLQDEERGLEAALAGPSPLTPSRAVEAPEEARMSWREVVGMGMALGVFAGLALVAVAEAVRPAVRTQPVSLGSASVGCLPDGPSRKSCTSAKIGLTMPRAVSCGMNGVASCPMPLGPQCTGSVPARGVAA